MKICCFHIRVFLLVLAVLITPINVSAVSVAVFPVADLSKGENSVNYELTTFLENIFSDLSVELIPNDTVISFMAQNRVRWLGYLDTSTVLKAREDMEVDLIVLSTVSQQRSQGAPSLGLSLQMIRAADGKVVWSGSLGRSLADEQKLLGINEPTSLGELQRLVATDLVLELPPDLSAIAVPPEGVEEEMARQPKIEIVTLGPKYIRPGEQIKCAVRVVTVSEAYEAPEVFIKVGSRVHLAREARDPLIYAEYEGDVFEATREYDDIIKEAEEEASQLFREAATFKAAPLREAEEEMLPLFQDAEKEGVSPLLEAEGAGGDLREAGEESIIREAEDNRRIRREAGEESIIREAEDNRRIRREAGDDRLIREAEDDRRIRREAGEESIIREARGGDISPLLEAEDEGRDFREAEAGSSPIHQAANEARVYYEAHWIGSDSMNGTSEARYNGIGTPTVDVAMASNDARFFEGIWSGTERDDRYPVSLVLRWPDGRQVVSFLGSYTVDSHPPRIGLDLKGDIHEGIVTFRDQLVVVPRLFNREPFSHWEIIIEDNMGNTVRKNRGWGNLPSQFVWRGRHTNGIKMPDGIYRIVLKVWDRAENMGSADQSVAFIYTPPAVELEAAREEKEFSLDISHQGKLPLAYWYLEIRSQSGKLIKSVEGESLPATVDLQLTTALKKDKLFGIIELRDVLGNKSRQEIEDLYQLALRKKEPEAQPQEDEIKVEAWDADF